MTEIASIEANSELPALDVEPISRTTLALFAGGSADHNPIHIDIDVTREAGMPDVFAHRMLSMAYLGRLLTARFGQSRIHSFGVRFASVTPVAAEPRCRGVVTSVDELDGIRVAHVELTVSLPDGTTTLRYGGRGAASGSSSKGPEGQW